MLIVDENSKSLIMDSIHVPTSANHFWALDLKMQDFTLAELKILEELWAPTIIVRINGFAFPLPASWNILAMDPETSQLDVVEVSSVAGKEFYAMVYDNDRGMASPGLIQAVDYKADFHNVNPSLNRHHMLCHPISNSTWICVAPNDSYNKYMKNMVVGNLL